MQCAYSGKKEKTISCNDIYSIQIRRVDEHLMHTKPFSYNYNFSSASATATLGIHVNKCHNQFEHLHMQQKEEKKIVV